MIGCKDVTPKGIHAWHRLKNKKNVIIRFVNRKDADMVLYNRKNLKTLDKGKFKLKDNIYLNENLCRPMQFLEYKARCAYREKKIKSYNLWKGKLSISHNYDIPISEPTNFEPNKKPSCIDQVITDQPNLILDSGTRHHQIIYCKVNFRIPPTPPILRKIWHFNRANSCAIKRSMTSFPWSRHLNLNTNTNWHLLVFS